VLTDSQRNALFVELHREIELAATRAAEIIAGVKLPNALAYPPNGGFTSEEGAALSSAAPRPEAVAAFRKIIADAAAAPLFTLFSLLDGVSDPQDFDGQWAPFHIAHATDTEREHLMLHDVLFDSYWLWRDCRPNPGWSLDTLPD
jgi:hypothetical protein